MADPLATEKAFLRENQQALSARHSGKYLLLKGAEVHGAYETYDQGVTAGVEEFGAGPFLVRSVQWPQDSESPRIPALSIGLPLVADP